MHVARYVEADTSTDAREIGISRFIKSEVVAKYADLAVIVLLSKERRNENQSRYNDG